MPKSIFFIGQSYTTYVGFNLHQCDQKIGKKLPNFANSSQNSIKAKIYIKHQHQTPFEALITHCKTFFKTRG